MPGTPTANHAYNLFSLTMESRYGSAWRSCVAPETVATLAHEIVQGFGGQADTVPEMDGGPAEPTTKTEATVWRFPDGSRAHTGAFGVKRDHDGESRENAA